MSVLLGLVAGSVASSAFVGLDAADDDAPPQTEAEQAKVDVADFIDTWATAGYIGIDQQDTHLDAQSAEMDKGDLINKVQEGAGLAASDDFLVVEDQIIARAAAYEDGADTSQDFIIIEDFVDALEMNKGDLINKVQEGAGRSNLIGTDDVITDRADFIGIDNQDVH